mmetsp:Transcript_15396/g.34503  ORF Transcript_15396/g.34503 Transcript_15396/m.34503 type:complete len:85 (-) Transcript_15396:1134-1388(-)
MCLPEVSVGPRMLPRVLFRGFFLGSVVLLPVVSEEGLGKSYHLVRSPCWWMLKMEMEGNYSVNCKVFVSFAPFVPSLTIVAHDR